MKRFEEIRDMLKVMKPDFEAYEVNPNKATGMRVIKDMERLVAIAQDIRADIQGIQKIRADIEGGKQN